MLGASFCDIPIDNMVEACNNEFTFEQMKSLYIIINVNECDPVDYIQAKYNELIERCENEELEPVNDRFEYLCSIVAFDCMR